LSEASSINSGGQTSYHALTSDNERCGCVAQGKADVHDASGLVGKATVVTSGPQLVFHATMTLADAAAGLNSYYILQVCHMPLICRRVQRSRSTSSRCLLVCAQLGTTGLTARD
jgi:hypothetical protein